MNYEDKFGYEKRKAPPERGFMGVFRVNNTKNALMVTLFASMSQGRNHYTVTSIDKVIVNLEKYHKIHVKRRWIFCCLAELLSSNHIKRKSRYVNDSNGLVTQIPSMITLTLRGVAYLTSKYVAGAKALYKSMIKFAKTGDKRWPAAEFKKDTSYRPATIEERKRLNDLLEGIGTKLC